MQSHAMPYGVKMLVSVSPQSYPCISAMARTINALLTFAIGAVALTANGSTNPEREPDVHMASGVRRWRGGRAAFQVQNVDAAGSLALSFESRLRTLWSTTGRILEPV
jgi:hypothetical protein